MKEELRKYHMSDADLMVLASEYVANLNRDSMEFAARGVTSLAIDNFEVLGNAFEVFPPDEVYLGQIKDETITKNSLRDAITVRIQSVSGYFDQKWGMESGKYLSLGIKGFHNFSDSNFLLTARNVAAQAETYLSDLSPIGLTQAMIDDLNADAQSFEDTLIEINNKKELRDTKTQERTEKGNELYDYVTLYSKIGKLIWENLDEAKYNDYVIYPKPEGGLGKVKNLAYGIGTTTASWDALQFADSYQLQWKPSTAGAEWEIAYEGTDTSAVFDPGVSSFYLRCRGHNAEGYGDWSDELIVLIPT